MSNERKPASSETAGQRNLYEAQRAHDAGEVDGSAMTDAMTAHLARKLGAAADNATQGLRERFSRENHTIACTECDMRFEPEDLTVAHVCPRTRGPRADLSSEDDLKDAESAREYLTRLLLNMAPNVEPIPSLLGIATQIDNAIYGIRDRITPKALADAIWEGYDAGDIDTTVKNVSEILLGPQRAPAFESQGVR